MYIIQRPQTDPYFNLAAEEYLLKTLDRDCFMLWINEPSIIIGKHQNTFAEVNPLFVEENKIPVIRRISGGGTVFHDPGNINFSFIAKGEKGKLVDFRKFVNPIILALNQLGIPAVFEGKNDLRVHGLKISGNAEHVYKNKVLHHGTLLFDSKLDKLGEAIQVRTGIFVDKAVQSNRSKVTNIINYLEHKSDVSAFLEEIISLVSKQFLNPVNYSFSQDDLFAINKLADEKYKSWEWNYAYSPPFNFNRRLNFENKEFDMNSRIEKGRIQNMLLTPSQNKWKEFFEILINEKFDPTHMISVLKSNYPSNSYDEIYLRHWVSTIFY